MKKLGFIVFIFFPSLVIAQSTNFSGLWGSHYDKANQLFEGRFYEEAIIHYQKEVERYDYHEDSYLKIANCYRILGDYEKSRTYYNIVLKTSEVEEPVHKFYFAEALLSMGEYEEAEIWYTKYSEDIPNDSRPNNRIEGIKKISTFYQDSSLVSIKPFSQNTNLTEFGAVKYRDAILFSSARSKDLIIQHDYLRKVESLLDLYSVNISEDGTEVVELVKLPKHSVSNDGPLAIGNDFVVVTRNVGKKKDEPINHLGLFFYESNIFAHKLLYEFPYNNHDYSIQHPALNARGDTLFFSSDMPGGFGSKDLYFSAYNGGKWTSPINMGQDINTPGEETFPFYVNGKLYFSSNGHPGLGGMDIYKVDKRKHGEEKIENLGYPINSGWDDFSIYIDGNFGYFASNRPGGLGHDDIYEFEIIISSPKEIKTLTPNVKLAISDYLDGKRVPFADILVINEETKDSLVFKASQEGEMTEVIEAGTYIVKISSKDYKEKEISLDLINKSMIVEEIFLEPELSLEDINLDGILFKYNDFKLSATAEIELNHIVELMERYPDLTLDIEAHTDSRGNSSYNLWLSEMRATHTANYLMEQGIEFERIKFAGYGESMLLNKCADFVECSEEEHAENRRILFEFIVDN